MSCRRRSAGGPINVESLFPNGDLPEPETRAMVTEPNPVTIIKFAASVLKLEPVRTNLPTSDLFTGDQVERTVRLVVCKTPEASRVLLDGVQVGMPPQGRQVLLTEQSSGEVRVQTFAHPSDDPCGFILAGTGGAVSESLPQLVDPIIFSRHVLGALAARAVDGSNNC